METEAIDDDLPPPLEKDEPPQTETEIEWKTQISIKDDLGQPASLNDVQPGSAPQSEQKRQPPELQKFR